MMDADIRKCGFCGLAISCTIDALRIPYQDKLPTTNATGDGAIELSWYCPRCGGMWRMQIVGEMKIRCSG